MKIKTYTSPGFSKINGFMESLPRIFTEEGETIKNDRNEIKIIWFGQLKLCIKSFNRITVFNRLMYSWFRASKAKRSFKAAMNLLELRLDTPPPVGYVEVYGRWNILKKSFYVSLYQEHDFDMAVVFNKSTDNWQSILTAFSRHMAAAVHPRGVWHDDLSQGNVLINRREHNRYIFSFIDLNRMKFKNRIPHSRGLVNLKRLTNQPVMLAIMAEQYALVAHKNPQFYTLLLLRSNFFFTFCRTYTKRVLHFFAPK